MEKRACSHGYIFTYCGEGFSPRVINCSSLLTVQGAFHYIHFGYTLKVTHLPQSYYFTGRRLIVVKHMVINIASHFTASFIIPANSTFWKYLGPKEACHMCKAVLNPSLRKLIHVYTTIPGKDQVMCCLTDA